MADQPNMTFSWAWPQVTSPSQPQQRALPTWGGVGTPGIPYAKFSPSTPVGIARTAAGFAGLGMTTDEVLASPAWRILSLTSGIACGYHGYKRNKGSIGWTLGWWFLGAVFPIPTLPLAVFQGYAKPARG